jgi:acetyltransferase-like isoleucine patch superfamily enzyme
MKISSILKNARIIYTQTTVLEGTIHLIKGGWKMFKILLISSYWKHNFSKCGKNLSIFPKTSICFPKNVFVGHNFSLKLGSYLRSENPVAKIIIGDNVMIGMQIMIDYSGGVEIDDNVFISDQVRIHTHSHGYNPHNKPKFKKLKIGRNVWIGEGAVVLPQVSEIGAGALIGAHTVVTKDVPPNTIFAGNPGKVIKQLNQSEEAK